MVVREMKLGGTKGLGGEDGFDLRYIWLGMMARGPKGRVL